MDLLSLKGMSVLMVGVPKLLVQSWGFLTMFLVPSFTDLPRSLSGYNSLSVGCPWMHLAAFQTSFPTTFLIP